MEKHHPHHEYRYEYWPMGFPWPTMDVEGGVKMLEEYKALTKELEKINKRLETLKH